MAGRGAELFREINEKNEMAKQRRSGQQRQLLSERRRAPEVFTGAQDEIWLRREQTWVLGRLLSQKSFQTKRQKEIDFFPLLQALFC